MYLMAVWTGRAHRLGTTGPGTADDDVRENHKNTHRRTLTREMQFSVSFSIFFGCSYSIIEFFYIAVPVRLLN